MRKLDTIIEERTLNIAQYMIDNCCTVRDAEKKFMVSKTTIHHDLTQRLPNYSVYLYNEIETLLNINKVERTDRGGQSTKMKYKNIKSNEN